MMEGDAEPGEGVRIVGGLRRVVQPLGDAHAEVRQPPEQRAFLGHGVSG